MSIRDTMIARACALLVLAGGCASAPVTAPVGRFEDTSFGLMRENRFPAAAPLATLPEWRVLSTGSDTWTGATVGEDPVTATGEEHYSWRSESPMAARPRRGRYFLSGFLVGFMARIAYGAYQGAEGQGVSGSNLGSAVTIGALTGLVTWSFSFRLSPTQMEKVSPEQEMPRLEDSSVYRDWTSSPRR